MTYMQTLFSFFNAPLFAVFIVGIFWKRASPAGGLWGYIAGIIAPMVVWIGYLNHWSWFDYATGTAETLYGAIWSFVTAVVVTVAVSVVTKPKPIAQLDGLVRGVGIINLKADNHAGDDAWYRSPAVLGFTALVLCVLLYIPFV